MEKRVFLVRALWDGEAGVWVAESDDVPGLVTEAENPQKLVEKLAVLIPELAELNKVPIDARKPLDIVLQLHGEERISLPVAA
jgi:predicted RNase H-like HicB family nuclease